MGKMRLRMVKYVFQYHTDSRKAITNATPISKSVLIHAFIYLISN